MDSKILAAIIVFVTNFRLCQSLRYDSYAMYISVPQNNEHLKFFQNLEKQKYIDMVFLRRPSKLYEVIQFVVNPKDISLLLERVEHFGINVDEINSNVQQLFDSQKVERRYLRFKPDSYTWDQYHTLDDIYQFMADLAVNNPEVCELIPVGKSSELKDIYALRIARKKMKKNRVIVEAGLHGNEWIASEFVTFLANQLLHANETNDSRLKVVANRYQWYLVPVVNPDGYLYSHSTDRLWKKNRNTYGEYKGVDLNRNFNHSFGLYGASNNPADNIYSGPAPFSEPETLALSQFVSNRAENLKFYFAIHAYGQKIIIPYGDTILHKENYDIAENYGKQALIKMYKLYGNKYEIGTSYDTLGEKTSGTSTSWVKKTHGVPFVYTFLLRDNGTVGHGLPPQDIIPSCNEALTGILEIMTTDYKRLRADLYDEKDEGNLARSDRALVLVALVFWFAK